jgi:hypothetical protein
VVFSLNIGKRRFVQWHQVNVIVHWSFPNGAGSMVEVVKISKEGTLLEIREISDRYRDRPYVWEVEE